MLVGVGLELGAVDAHQQAFLFPPDLQDWLLADDWGHFVIEAVERVDLGAFKVNHRGTGSAQYHPRMMLALVIYCYANGTFSSRRIERATHRDIGVRFVAANRHPDHDTIARFRRENFAAMSEMRSRTWASQARGSTSLSLAVSIRVYRGGMFGVQEKSPNRVQSNTLTYGAE